MIQTSVDANHNLVIFKNKSSGTKPAIDAAFRLVKRQFETLGSVKLLIDWTEYQGLKDSRHAANRIVEATEYIDRLAFVVGPQWRQEADFLIRLIQDRPAKRFDSAEREVAIAWLIGH
jgi:hypothetical protein